MKANRFCRIAVLASCLAAPFSLAQAADITVSAAASLTNAFTALGKAYEAQNPGDKVTFNFAASGTLLQQAENGAPVDVLAFADEKTMDKAQSKQLINEASRANFATNDLVVIMPKNTPLSISRLQDLLKPAFKLIAIGNPGYVPAGRYAKIALENQPANVSQLKGVQPNLYKGLESRFILGNNVRQVLDYVSRQEVQAGFVYRTDAMLFPDRVTIVYTAALPNPVTYPIAVMKNAAHPAEAKRFEAFVLSPEGKKILAQYGFTVGQ